MAADSSSSSSLVVVTVLALKRVQQRPAMQTRRTRCACVSARVWNLGCAGRLLLYIK